MERRLIDTVFAQLDDAQLDLVDDALRRRRAGGGIPPGGPWAAAVGSAEQAQHFVKTGLGFEQATAGSDRVHLAELVRVLTETLEEALDALRGWGPHQRAAAAPLPQAALGARLDWAGGGDLAELVLWPGTAAQTLAALGAGKFGCCWWCDASLTAPDRCDHCGEPQRCAGCGLRFTINGDCPDGCDPDAAAAADPGAAGEFGCCVQCGAALDHQGDCSTCPPL